MRQADSVLSADQLPSGGVRCAAMAMLWTKLPEVVIWTGPAAAILPPNASTLAVTGRYLASRIALCWLHF